MVQVIHRNQNPSLSFKKSFIFFGKDSNMLMVFQVGLCKREGNGVKAPFKWRSYSQPRCMKDNVLLI